jgi:hypothetical protein
MKTGSVLSVGKKGRARNPGFDRLVFSQLDKTLGRMREMGKEIRKQEFEELYGDEKEQSVADDNAFLVNCIKKEASGGTLSDDEKRRYERLKKERGTKLRSVEEDIEEKREE